MASAPLRIRAQIVAMRLLTALLKLLGQRERVAHWRWRRARRRRLAAEAAGSDRLSRPALHEMDMRLDEIIDRDGGFFVEAGANDGFTQSNTYWLERFRGWRGLLVEPVPELAALARTDRPDATVVSCALVPADEDGGTVTVRFGSLMSSVLGSHGDDAAEAAWVAPGLVLGWSDPYDAEVPARSLSAVLDELEALPSEIDLVSLDVEGYELEVLRGLDLTRHAPRWLLVEVHDPAADRPPIEALLGERYVVHRMLSPLDVLYRRADVPAPAARA